MYVMPFETTDPVAPDFYDRAVFRRPPPCFSVEILPPIKHGGNLGYRMFISSIYSDGASLFSSASQSPYEIWRRWSDCLMFQDTLEVEYSRMARSKKQRLAAGKGIKKNGIYIHDHASSFESLPNGPDPSSVHLDIHHYLPKLTKKGSLFRANQATVNQRRMEMEALIEHLFSPDVPALLHELRQEPVITDFFGYWRRDHDRVLDLNGTSAINPRSSTSNSVFSLYFSPVVGQDRPPSPLPQPSPSKSSGLSTSAPSSESAQTSSDSFSSVSSRDSGGSDCPLITTRESELFGQWPEQGSDGRHEGRAIRTPPDEREDVGPNLAINFGPYLPPMSRIHKSPRGPRENRRGQIFTTPPILSPNLQQNHPGDVFTNEKDAVHVFTTPPILSPNSQNHPGDVFTNEKDSVHVSDLSSRVSVVSSSDYLEQLDLLLGYPEEDQSFRNSVATFRTDCSADAVIPRLPSYISLVQSSCNSSQDRPRSISEDLLDDLADSESLTIFGDESSSNESSPYDSSFGDYSERNPVRLTDFFRPRSNSSISTSSSSSSSTSTSTSTTCAASFTQDETRSITETLASSIIPSPPTSPSGMLTVKAALNDSIIVLRVPRTICFNEIKRRLYDKFVRQEGVLLSKSFAIVQIMATTTSPAKSVFSDRRHLLSDSVSAAGVLESVSGSVQMREITSQQGWEEAVGGVAGFKSLTLYIAQNSP